ncbi:hypothetical protein GlitD10_1430 [Gloeomargarita lithophora Alchichica-D10]|uniref:HepT-like domain-containing protein n=1 Tax=Gloeomargarita lithophora Alchichica-D10 TaxID=1188229 RepID=A0A1J0ACV9_9CYAN|nr:hypothetical protein [Gloeomargarita lithophora]APB33751.1 hypothetical protein GlitD10_1430 [Gloeomargarita lithophora Alchichica-D10]
MINYEIFGDAILAELKKVGIAKDKVILYHEKAQQIQDEVYCYACAIHLFNFYVGCERIFKLVAREIDRYIPTGEDSHKQIIEQMNRPNKYRPALISEEVKSLLDDYRKFRHLFINIYAFELDEKKLQILINNLPKTHEYLSFQVYKFYDFLVELANASE